MNINRLTTLLLLVVMLLVVLLLRPILVPSDVYSAKTYQYMTLDPGDVQKRDRDKTLEKKLNQYGAEGWKLHSIYSMSGIVILER